MKRENAKGVRASCIRFQEHVQTTITYPEIIGRRKRYFIGPINAMYDYTDAKEFLDRTIHLTTTFAARVSDRIGHTYRETRRQLIVKFFYPKSTLANDHIVLNSEVRTTYPNKTRQYAHTVQGRYGCDGLGEILAIIDKTWQPKKWNASAATEKPTAKSLNVLFGTRFLATCHA